jgi:hypothetical protein
MGPFRFPTAAVTVYSLLDLRGAIPNFIHMPDGKQHDVHVLDLSFRSPVHSIGMDRGYLKTPDHRNNKVLLLPRQPGCL